MDSITRARYILLHMGGGRHIYWDRRFKCFRVLSDCSRSFEKYGNDNFELVE